MKKSRDDLLDSPAGDPILDFPFMIADLGVSRSTFLRRIREQLPVIQLSARRIGVRRSDYEAWKRSIVPGKAA